MKICLMQKRIKNEKMKKKIKEERKMSIIILQSYNQDENCFYIKLSDDDIYEVDLESNIALPVQFEGGLDETEEDTWKSIIVIDETREV